jgi:hypothetical protein
MRILQFAPNRAAAECLLPVNFGLEATANSQVTRKESNGAMTERVNPKVCRHALRGEQGAVHVHELGLIYRPDVLNLRVE